MPPSPQNAWTPSEGWLRPYAARCSLQRIRLVTTLLIPHIHSTNLECVNGFFFFKSRLLNPGKINGFRFSAVAAALIFVPCRRQMVRPTPRRDCWPSWRWRPVSFPWRQHSTCPTWQCAQCPQTLTKWILISYRHRTGKLSDFYMIIFSVAVLCRRWPFIYLQSCPNLAIAGTPSQSHTNNKA